MPSQSMAREYWRCFQRQRAKAQLSVLLPRLLPLRNYISRLSDFIITVPPSRKYLASRVVLFGIIVSAILFSSGAFVGPALHKAYADGGDRKEIPASLNGRQARLLVQLSPPILTNERTDQDAFFLFRLYDPPTNTTFKYVSLFLFITKDGKQLIPPDLYQSDQGIIKLKIQRAPGDTVIYADREPVLNGLYADQGGIIKVKGPILQEGGLYRIHVEIFGIDSYYTIFNQADIPKFDVYLSVGDFYQKPVSENGTSYNMTVISYYDKITNMTFDQPKKTLTWSMPLTIT